MRMRWLWMLAALVLSVSPRSVGAQLASISRVTVLPTYSAAEDSVRALALNEVLRRSIEEGLIRSRFSLFSPDEPLSGESLRKTISSQASLAAYAATRTTDFMVVSALLTREGGRKAVFVAVYSVEDDRYLLARSQDLEVEEAALRWIEAMGEYIASPRVLALYDSAVIYSLLLPGSGQLMLGEPVRALLSVALVLGAATYRMGFKSTHPSPYVRAFEATQVRKRRSRLLALAWLFNVGDTVLILSEGQRRINMELQYLMIDLVPAGTGGAGSDAGIMLRLRILLP